jgi:predicted Rossmann fold flavoprotein
MRCGCQVLNLNKDERFNIATSHGTFGSPSLVIATGGLSIAPLGATDFGYQIARQFGLQIEEPRPGLVPFTLTSRKLKQLTKLTGVSLDALVSHGGKDFRENILFTHRGLSGPAILQISSYWKPGTAISIDLLPDQDALGLLTAEQGSDIGLANLLSRHLPKRFAEVWCQLFAATRPLRQYNSRELNEIAERLHNMQITPAGTEGFKKAEVTAGGVSTVELSSQTMEAKHVPGLYFIGEVVDVTGQLGGYNFQWAWASGFAAGQAV